MDENADNLRRLDDQWKLGLWDMDVALPFLVSLFLAWLNSSWLGWLLLPVAGLMASRRMSRLKWHTHEAIAWHWAYWHLPSNPMTSMRATPPSHLRRMVG
ncbi:MAG TPA: type IV conjugative transfer system protein TraL [Burkholderiaceae bacterium]|nr:type IV conjugative transfer system protein TraL [Burkholderiaceae bacterium]